MEGIDAARVTAGRPPAAEDMMERVQRWGGAPMLIGAFAVLHTLLLQLGYALKTSVASPSVMWPSAGIALAALWLAPRRLWAVLLLVQFGIEVGTAALWMSSFQFGLVSLYTLANIAGTVVSAALASWRIHGMDFMRARAVTWFVVVTAVGAAASASVALPVHLIALGDAAAVFDAAQRIEMWQLWAAGHWLGIVVVAPLLVSWLSPMRAQFVELRLRSPLELLVLFAVLLAASFYVSMGSGHAQSLLQLPTTIVMLMIVAVMRLPPRWVVTLFSTTAVTMTALAAHRGGVGGMEMTLSGVGQLQVFLVTLGLFAFVLSVTLAERSITARRLQESESRYRNFVELSTEAMWRIEFAQPMPSDLPPAEQVDWLRNHACIAEFSRSYELLDARAAGHGEALAWDPAVPWVAAFEAQLRQAASQSFTLDGLRFEVDGGPGRRRSFVACFNGVTADGQLQRIWGVARDITELTELNASLLRERERLKSYARQIVTAEEKARRATAVDLHDGIGQSLAGMAMTLDVARQHASPEVKLLVEEVRARLFEVQEKTRSMISDLSPPGLYELGLKAALQWLAVYVRGNDRLQVQMDIELREECVPLDTRVLVFKLVRELLRNVVKHAGVNEARVQVRGDAEALQVQVSDEGCGFEWQYDLFGARSGGFGLWSISDRVHEAGGEFEIDAAPGRGARFTLTLPLKGGRLPDRRPQAPQQQQA